MVPIRGAAAKVEKNVVKKQSLHQCKNSSETSFDWSMTEQRDQKVSGKEVPPGLRDKVTDFSSMLKFEDHETL